MNCQWHLSKYRSTHPYYCTYGQSQSRETVPLMHFLRWVMTMTLVFKRSWWPWSHSWITMTMMFVFRAGNDHDLYFSGLVMTIPLVFRASDDHTLSFQGTSFLLPFQWDLLVWSSLCMRYWTYCTQPPFYCSRNMGWIRTGSSGQIWLMSSIEPSSSSVSVSLFFKRFFPTFLGLNRISTFIKVNIWDKNNNTKLNKNIFCG